jgi:cell division GTPase FtsZ
MIRLKIVNSDESQYREEIKKEEKGETKKMTEETLTNGFDIPEVNDEEVKKAEDAERGVLDESKGAITYAFIGSGQGGSRLAEAFYSFGYKKCIAVNTAAHDLKEISIPDTQKFTMQLDGLSGAGKDMSRGAAAAQKYDQEIYNLMKRVFGKCDRIIVCIGAGGGTGGGSVFNLLGVAKKYLNYLGVQDVDKKLGVVCSIPDNGECASPVVSKNALAVIEPLCDFAEAGTISPLIFVDNQKIRKLFPKLTMNTFWSTVNKTIAGMFHVFNTMATKSSKYTSFDSADYNSIMSAAGCLIMGATKVKDFNDEQSIAVSIKSNLERTLFAEGFELSTAKAVGSIVIGGDTLFNTVPGLPESINYGFDTLANITGNSIVYRGIYEEKGNSMVVYNIITGLNRPVARLEELDRFLKSRSNTLYGEKK